MRVWAQRDELPALTPWLLRYRPRGRPGPSHLEAGMAERRRVPLSSEGRVRVGKKIAKMMREEREKPKEDRRSKEQITAIAFDMERRGDLS